MIKTILKAAAGSAWLLALIYVFSDLMPTNSIIPSSLRRMLATATVDAITRDLGAVDRPPYTVLADVDNYPVHLGQNPGDDIPYFFHIHKSGGTTMKDILGICLRKVQTHRVDEEDCSDQEDTIRVCSHGPDQWSILNADASSFEGIDRAVAKNLCCEVQPEIPLDDSFVVGTSRFFDALPVFTPYRKGRLFGLFRHPVERALSKYHYIKKATWEKNFKEQAVNQTIMEFVNSPMCYDNWVVRRLIHKMPYNMEITEEDLALAKEIVKRKMLVLLTDDMEGSVERMRQYFGWDEEVLTDEQMDCIHRYAVEEPRNANPHETLDPDSDEYQAIRNKNLADIELYEYVQQLYQEQGEMIAASKRSTSSVVAERSSPYQQEPQQQQQPEEESNDENVERAPEQEQVQEQPIHLTPPTINSEERAQVLAHYPEIQLLRKVAAIKKPIEKVEQRRDVQTTQEERTARETSTKTLYPEFEKFRKSNP